MAMGGMGMGGYSQMAMPYAMPYAMPMTGNMGFQSVCDSFVFFLCLFVANMFSFDDFFS